ncbi:protein FAR1-RELATED SEQUENCE 5-like [Arachis hypogaea]|uniref:protein FAR1-RELATED SEQUENCE 5-like n=1 Tax=Arachis hypogaea TaxID=3818 RepID=UPI0010FC61FB|nr:protein FAR1-RELATED SEQUENCE 5-like [Arachis hypogaea]
MKDTNQNFFYAVKLDEECKFKSALWVDARCRASYEYYGDAVSVDSTYSTNKHGLPFVSFVGVNHHGKSILIGCALLGNEEIPSYELVFSQWVKYMGTALQHLYDDRRMWVPIYFKDEFWASIRSTRRSESMHTFYGGYLHSKTNLEQRELEDDAADSRGVIPCATTSRMEKQFQQKYTMSILWDVQTEFVKKANCKVFVVDEHGPLVCVKVEEEILVNDTILCVLYDVQYDPST